MKNLWTTIMVKDLEASLKFYTEVLDLKVATQFNPTETMSIVMLGEGETKLELIYNSDVKEINYTDFVSTGFGVESVEKTISRLEANGVSIHSGPFEPSPFVKYFFVKDPNGYKIQLVENRN